MKFEVRVPIEGYATYFVEAESESEAREFVYEGDPELYDSFLERSDTDYNHIEVSVLLED